jgi:hypothetical protein
LDDVPETRMAEAQDVIVAGIAAALPDLDDRIEAVASDDPLWETMERAIAGLLRDGEVKADEIEVVEEHDADAGKAG